MKRFVRIVTILGAFVMIVGVPSAFGAPPDIYSSDGWQPMSFEVENTCVPEQIIGTGMFTFRYMGQPDSAGGWHGPGTWNARGTAVGQTTGAGYVYSDLGKCAFNDPQGDGSVMNCTWNIHLVSLDPQVPDLYLAYPLRIVVDANGVLRLFYYAEPERCSPS